MSIHRPEYLLVQITDPFFALFFAKINHVDPTTNAHDVMTKFPNL